MKLQLDLAQKTIITNEDLNLGELINALAKLFPEEQWREYTLQRGHINWTTEPMFPLSPPYSAPWIQPLSGQPYYGGGTLTTSNSPTGTTLTNSVYNIELQK